jgi:hypothetical protein
MGWRMFEDMRSIIIAGRKLMDVAIGRIPIVCRILKKLSA